jgi:hypothetical protein
MVMLINTLFQIVMHRDTLNTKYDADALVKRLVRSMDFFFQNSVLIKVFPYLYLQALKKTLKYCLLFANYGIPHCTQVGHPHKPQPAEPPQKQEKKRESSSADRPSDSTYLLRKVESKGAPSIAG